MYDDNYERYKNQPHHYHHHDYQQQPQNYKCLNESLNDRLKVCPCDHYNFGNGSVFDALYLQSYMNKFVNYNRNVDDYSMRYCEALRNIDKNQINNQLFIPNINRSSRSTRNSSISSRACSPDYRRCHRGIECENQNNQRYNCHGCSCYSREGRVEEGTYIANFKTHNSKIKK